MINWKERFFYSGTLNEEHVELVTVALKKIGNWIESEEIKKDLNTKYPLWEDEGNYKAAAIKLNLPVYANNKYVANAKTTLSFYQENTPVFEINISTRASLPPRTLKESGIDINGFWNLCEDIYYATKPLVGLGEEFYYTLEEEREAIERFIQTGNIKDLLIERNNGKQLPGFSPYFYSPEILEQLQQLGVKIDSNAKKLKDGGMINELWKIHE